MNRKLGVISFFLLVTLPLQACENATVTTPGNLVTPSFSYSPLFETSPCTFIVPEGLQPDCGTLLIPEDRGNPESRWIRLGVAIFHSTNPSPAPDPVIHLVGGPGSSALGNALPIIRKGGMEILEQRDYILFDQRGTQYAEPYLFCQPYDEYLWDAHEQDLTLEQFNDGALPFLQQCLDEWRRDGVALSAYTSAESAADVNDLRLALGYEQVNLYAVSYGTRLALTVMRDYPEGIRSVILDSVEPLEEELGYASLAFNANRSLQLVFKACAADKFCSNYGDLEKKFYAVIQRLEKTPVEIESDGPYRATPYVLVLDGDLFIDMIFGSLYSMKTIADIPSWIDAAYREDYTGFSLPVGAAIGMPGSTGLFWTTTCWEEAPFARSWQEFLLGIGVPRILKAHFTPVFISDVCALWDVPPADLLENKPVFSSIPTIIFSGGFDPITPPSWAKKVARSLSAAFFYEFPTMSHGVVRSDPCALQMALSFLENSTLAPDSSCVGTQLELVFH
jgi:pimeloyl-ACP methyl ester carboxylesterase